MRSTTFPVRSSSIFPGRSWKREWPNCCAEVVAWRWSTRLGFPTRTSRGWTPARLSSFAPLGVEVVSSGDLIQQFEATWDDDQWAMHLEAEKVTKSAYDMAFPLIAERVRAGGTIRETEVQSAIMEHFHRHGLTTYSPPIVAVGPHSGDPHYEPVAGKDGTIGLGDFVLIDLWAKLDRPRSVYSDLTRVGFVGDKVPAQYEKIFQIVAQARDAAIACVRDAYAAGRPLQGWEVDAAGPPGHRRRRSRSLLHPPDRT